MSLKSGATLLSLVFWAGVSAALELPELSGVTVSAELVSEPASEIVRYHYRVGVDEAGVVPVDSFAIDVRSDESRFVSGEGLSFVGPHLANATSYSTNLLGPKGYVPVGVESMPQGWASAIQPDGFLGFGPVGDDASSLSPGGTPGEFVVTSRGLPGVRDGIAGGDYFDLLPNADDPGESAEAVAEALRDSDRVVKTIGPVAPPVDLDLASYASYIDDLRGQSEAQGWIRDGATSASLGKQIAELRSSLAASDFVPAKVVAASLIAAVESISCESFSACPPEVPLTSEARALLAANTRYLLSKIPNTPPLL